MLRLIAGRSAGDFAALHDALTALLQAEVTRLSALDDDARDLDRAAIAALLDDHGFDGPQLGLELDAPLPIVLGQLMHLHEEQLMTLKLLAERYPGGAVDLSDARAIALPDSLGPED